MMLSKENWLAVFAAIAYTESRMPRVYTSRTADFLPLRLFELDRGRYSSVYCAWLASA